MTLQGQYVQTELVSPSPENNGFFGSELVAGSADFNGDGIRDYAIGCPEGGGPTLRKSGRVFLFSGKNHQLIDSLVSPQERPAAFFGISVSFVPDVNGDEVEELLVGGMVTQTSMV